MGGKNLVDFSGSRTDSSNLLVNTSYNFCWIMRGIDSALEKLPLVLMVQNLAYYSLNIQTILFPSIKEAT